MGLTFFNNFTDAFEGYDLDGEGTVSRDNLRKMFKAYFYITIELVRDVVKACEEEMVCVIQI